MAENNISTIEEWRAVVGYEGHYEVSNIGRVRTINSFHYNRIGKILKPALKHGYPRITLSKTSKKRGIYVHRLVAEAFIGHRPAGYQVNHIDGIKTNNTPNNLEYVTPKQNQQHASRLGLLATGKRCGAYTHPEKLRRGDNHPARTDPSYFHRGDKHWSKRCPEKVARGENHWSKRLPEKVLKGESNPSAKLTEVQVKEILSEFTPGYGQLVKFARRYNVDPSCIRLIVYGHNWKHLR